jgi:P4 family phage/plasmid primase-like protien
MSGPASGTRLLPDRLVERSQVPASVTIVTNAEGTLTKRASFDRHGGLCIAPAAALARGTFRTLAAPTVDTLASIVRGLTHAEALLHGIARNEASSGQLATAHAVEKATCTPEAIARTAECFVWADGPGWLMLDFDLKDLPPHLANSLDPISIDRLREAVVAVGPELADMPMLALPSTSAMLYRATNFECLRGLTGVRMYVPVHRAGEIPGLGERLHERLVLAGWGWLHVSRAGTLSQPRSLVDASVWTPERLDFIGGAKCEPGIVQQRGEPKRWNAASSHRLSLDLLPPLTEDERERYHEIVARLRATAKPQAEKVRAAYMGARRKAGHPTAITYTHASEVQHLDGAHEILLVNGAWVTVDAILADTERYHGQRCADPLDPDGYGGDHRIAVVYTKNQTTGPAIHSFAHGGATYLLRASAAAADLAVCPYRGSGMHSVPTPASLPPAPADDHYTDMGNAARFARAYRDRVRHSGGGWLVWDGKRWVPDEDGTVKRLAKQIVREMYREATDVQDEGRRQRLIAWAVKSEAHARLSAMIDLAKSELPAPVAKLDADPSLFNVENGTLDTRTGVLAPHDPADLLTKLAPVLFEPNAECPTWLAFLERIFSGDQELIRFAQKAVGYTLTGENTEQCLLLLFGTGQNGKSTFLEVVRAVLGDYAKQADFSTFLATKTTGPRNDLARLQGARFVAAIEAGAGERLAENVIKQLTGGDTISARLLYREAVEFVPQFKLWLAANHKPEVRGNDYAIWRRIRLIPFAVTIPEEERDPHLKVKLMAERAGILRWAVEGCLAWRDEGLGIPLAVRDATAVYRAEMDVIAAFLSDTCIVAPEIQVPRKQLYAAYLAWCRGRNDIPESAQRFNARLAAYDPARIHEHKSNGERVWRGIEPSHASARGSARVEAEGCAGKAMTLSNRASYGAPAPTAVRAPGSGWQPAVPVSDAR